mgnify:CR=1 FL=1
MRVEQAYPGEALRHLRTDSATPRQQTMLYFTTGEVVEPGTYHCTFCAHVLRLRGRVALPLCSSCDSSEFIVGGEPADSIGAASAQMRLGVAAAV